MDRQTGNIGVFKDVCIQSFHQNNPRANLSMCQPKSKIDFMRISAFYYFSLKEQSKDQKSLSVLTYLCHLFFYAYSSVHHMFWAHQSI